MLRSLATACLSIIASSLGALHAKPSIRAELSTDINRAKQGMSRGKIPVPEPGLKPTFIRLLHSTTPLCSVVSPSSSVGSAVQGSNPMMKTGFSSHCPPASDTSAGNRPLAWLAPHDAPSRYAAPNLRRFAQSFPAVIPCPFIPTNNTWARPRLPSAPQPALPWTAL